jgi:hypothetical protein
VGIDRDINAAAFRAVLSAVNRRAAAGAEPRTADDRDEALT